MIDEEIKKYVNKAKEHFRKIKERVGNETEPENSIAKNWHDLKYEITGLAGIVKGKEADRTGLLGIKRKIVNEYANRFTKNKQMKGFGGILEEWIKTIIENNAGVKGWIGRYYVENTTGKSNYFKSDYITMHGFDLTKTSLIAEKIKNALSGKDGIKIKDADVDRNNELQGNITEVYNCVNGFAATLGNKLDEEKITAPGEMSKLVNAIAHEIEKEVRQQYSKSNLDYSLERTVKIILSALHSAAQRVAEELKSFAGVGNTVGNIGKNVDDAIKRLAYIEKQFDGTDDDERKINNSPDYGYRIDTALDCVNEQIDELHTALSTSIQNRVEMEFEDAHADPDKVTKLMTRYAGHVGGTTDGAKQESIYGKIAKLHGEALKAFKGLDGIINAKSIGNNAVTICEHLSSFCNAIIKAASDGADSVSGRLVELRDTLIGRDGDGRLKEIYNKLNELQQRGLTPIIESMDRLLDEADEYVSSLIEQLEMYISRQLDDAKTNITETTRTKYVECTKLLLTKFSEKINDELQMLPNEITADSDKGCKSFMNVLEQRLHFSGLTGNLPTNAGLSDLASYVKSLFTNLIQTLNRKPEILPKHNSTMQLHNSLKTLFTDLTKYDQKFADNLSSLASLIRRIRPDSYLESSNILLDILRNGVAMLHGELEKAYVSVYDGETFGANLVEKNKITPYGTKFAKVCLTVISILNTSLSLLKHNSKNLSGQQTHNSTDLGRLIEDHGYVVSNSDTEQNGEVNRHLSGRRIHTLLAGNDYEHVYHTDNNVRRPLENIYIYLNDYYKIGHIGTSSSKRRPCSIYEMLCWLSGLPCNDVFEDLWRDAVSELFVNPNNQPAPADDIPVAFVGDEPLEAYPRPIAYDDTQRAVKRLCSRSYDVLIKIVGYGNEHTQYAVDYCDNSLRLAYPSDPSQCLELLLDILRRLLPVFRFLHSQCQLGTQHFGWSNCLYGRDILTDKSQCNKHPDDKQTDCLPRSPLQSYLSDTLPGHLPHNISSIGCKSVCSNCPKGLPGQPCLTPLGFRGFSGSTNTGKHLCKVLTNFFDKLDITPIFGLMTKPPSTLPEHFQFALTLAEMLQKAETSSNNAVSVAFGTSTKELSIGLYEDISKLPDALCHAYKNSQSHDRTNHPKALESDLSSLSKTESCTYASADKLHCAPYLRSLCDDSYSYLAEWHSKLYLSWAIHLPSTLYAHIKSLRDAFCSISCKDWGCRRCLNGNKCRHGKHGIDNCECRGLIECRGVLSTLYSFGFTFGNPATLSSEESKKYCHNFYKQLCNVLNSTYFTELFKRCDEFIFTIRQPFIWLNVALWSLSLFYLICVMVGRLDVLHIRSHLRIPSSHKITAQSLLAAAQVGRLAKISYLQP